MSELKLVSDDGIQLWPFLVLCYRGYVFLRLFGEEVSSRQSVPPYLTEIAPIFKLFPRDYCPVLWLLDICIIILADLGFWLAA